MLTPSTTAETTHVKVPFHGPNDVNLGCGGRGGGHWDFDVAKM